MITDLWDLKKRGLIREQLKERILDDVIAFAEAKLGTETHQKFKVQFRIKPISPYW